MEIIKNVRITLTKTMLPYLRHMIKIFLKLAAKLKKAYFTGRAQITLAFIISGTVFCLF